MLVGFRRSTVDPLDQVASAKHRSNGCFPQVQVVGILNKIGPVEIAIESELEAYIWQLAGGTFRENDRSAAERLQRTYPHRTSDGRGFRLSELPVVVGSPAIEATVISDGKTVESPSGSVGPTMNPRWQLNFRRCQAWVLVRCGAKLMFPVAPPRVQLPVIANCQRMESTCRNGKPTVHSERSWNLSKFGGRWVSIDASVKLVDPQLVGVSLEKSKRRCLGYGFPTAHAAWFRNRQ